MVYSGLVFKSDGAIARCEHCGGALIAEREVGGWRVYCMCCGRGTVWVGTHDHAKSRPRTSTRAITDDDRERIRQWWGRYSLRAIARRLGRSYGSVRRAVVEMGLSRSNAAGTET